MPLQYSSIVKEHLTVRTTLGLFDLSHMGELEVYGQGANALVQKLSTNDVGRLTDGRALYTLFCNKTGELLTTCLCTDMQITTICWSLTQRTLKKIGRG